ncbi:MAG TPA: hypothetical protein VGM08_01205 [Candidatus Saccharimonadales bacterium]|jgi:hypothetical protein
MVRSHEGPGSEPKDDGPDSKNPKRRTATSKATSARTVRFPLNELRGNAADQRREFSRTERSSLTDALLGELKAGKDGGTKPKTKPEVGAAVAADRAEPKEPSAKTMETADVPEAVRTLPGSDERAVAEDKEDGDDGARDDSDRGGDTVVWAKNLEAEKSPPEGEVVGGDIYLRLNKDEEKPADSTEAGRPPEEAAAELAAIPLEASEATAKESVAVDFGWHEQPPQQHQARDHEAPPVGPELPTAPAAASGGSGEVPPPSGSGEVAFGQPPEPERSRPGFVPVAAAERAGQPEPAEVFREYARRDAETAGYAQAVSPAEPLVTRREANEQAYYAERTGQNRGLVTGLLVGGAYVHFKDKRREKKTAKAHQEQVRKLQDAQEAQTWAAKEQTQKQTETVRQLESVEARLAAAEKRPQFQSLPPAEAARLAEQQRREWLPAQGVPEAQQPHAAEQSAEQLAIPPEHRIESSAWHHIEIDARTGRPVETPTFMYGREYYRERAHESTPLAQRNAAAGEVALAAATGGGGGTGGTNGAGSGGVQSDDTPLSSADIPNASIQGPPGRSRQMPSQPFSAPAPKASRTVTPLWPYLVTLVAILICLVFLLH